MSVRKRHGRAKRNGPAPTPAAKYDQITVTYTPRPAGRSTVIGRVAAGETVTIAKVRAMMRQHFGAVDYELPSVTFSLRPA